MKVRIEFTVEVDEDAWDLNYGPHHGVRQDVKNYAESLVKEHFAEVGVLETQRARVPA